MRISTFTMNQTAVEGIDADQFSLSKTQNQIASGKSVSTPADNPIAAVEIAQLTAVISTNTQYKSNGNIATASLGLEQTTLTDTTNTLQSVRDLLVQANSGANNTSNLKSIATQIQSLENALLGTANSKDANGNYLFSGFSAGTQPFSRNTSGAVTYSGDSGVSSLEISSNTSVQLNDPGSAIYMNVPAGNGTFTTAAGAGNTGTGVIDTGSVTSRAAWVPGTYTISFTDATDYTVKDAGGTTVATGTYNPASGGNVAFDGIQVGITGAPTAGDTFTVASAGTQSMFSTLDNIVTALNAATGGSASRAQLSSQLNGALQQIDQSLSQVSTVTTSVAARINLVSSVTNSLASQNTSLATQVSNLGDLDYAQATSQLSEQSVALQAAESSYAAIAQLSLFKYL